MNAGGQLTNTVSSSGALHNHTTSSDILQETWSSPSIHHMIDGAGILVDDWTFAPIIFEIKSLIHADLHLGIHMDFHVGAHIDFHVLFHIECHSVPAMHLEISGMHYHSADFDLNTRASRIDDVIADIQQIQTSMRMSAVDTIVSNMHLVMPGPPPAPPPIIAWPVTWGAP